MVDQVETVTVEQEDRNFAADYGIRFGRFGELHRRAIEDGKWDHTDDVQLVARHRLASVSSASTELEAGKDELRRLMDSIWRAEYRKESPDWSPLDDLPGMVSQIDNMYAGVRGQRDQARWDLHNPPASPEPVPATNQAGEVEIKPLTWTEPHASHSYPNWYARVYSIKFEARIDTGKSSRHGKFPLSINGDMIDKKFETVEDAKAYAQNDYAQRVLAALATQPATSQEGEIAKIGPRSRLSVIANGGTVDKAYHPSTFSDPVRAFWTDVQALAATPTPPTLSEDLRALMQEAHDTMHECTAVLTANDCLRLWPAFAPPSPAHRCLP